MKYLVKRELERLAWEITGDALQVWKENSLNVIAVSLEALARLKPRHVAKDFLNICADILRDGDARSWNGVEIDREHVFKMMPMLRRHIWNHHGIMGGLLACLNQYDLGWKAAEALGKVSETATQDWVLEELLARIKQNEDETSRNNALDALRRMGVTVARYPGVLEELLTRSGLDENYWSFSDAIDAWKGMSEKEAQTWIIETVTTYLENNRSIIVMRMWHRYLMSERRNGNKKNIDPLQIGNLMKRMEKFKYHSLREKSIEALGSMGSAAAEHPGVLEELLKCLKEENGWLQHRAAVAIGEMNKPIAQKWMLEELLSCLNQKEDKNLRIHAAEALGTIGRMAAEFPGILDTLLVCLIQEEDEYLREEAIKALGNMGQAAAEYPGVLVGLFECLKVKGNDMLHACVADALTGMGEAVAKFPDALPTLLAYLRQKEDTKLCEIAASVLGRIRTAAEYPGILVELFECLKHEDLGLRQSAITALGNMADYPGVLEALKERSTSVPEHMYARRSAVDALGKIGRSAAEHPGVLEALEVCIDQEDDGYLRNDAVSALREMQEVGVRFFLKDGALYWSVTEALAEGAEPHPV